MDLTSFITIPHRSTPLSPEPPSCDRTTNCLARRSTSTMRPRSVAGAGRHEADAAPSLNHFRRVLNVPPLQKRQLEDGPSPSVVASFGAPADPTPAATEDAPSSSRGVPRGEQETRTGSDDERSRTGRASPSSAVAEGPEPTNETSSETLSSEAETSTEEPESQGRSSEASPTPTPTSDESTSTVSTSSTSAPSRETSSVSSPTTSSASTLPVESTTLAPSTTGTSARSPSLAQSWSSTVTTSARPSTPASSSEAAPAENDVSESTVIIASVSGTLALIAIVLLVLFCVRRKRQKRRKSSDRTSLAKDGLGDYPDTAFLTHSRTALGPIETEERDRVPAKVSRAALSPTAVAHPPQGCTYPPQGYTRPARLYPLANVGPGGPRVSRDAFKGMHPPNWAGPSRGGAGDIAAARSPIVGVGDGTLESNRPSSLFLPTSPVNLPPTKQQQMPQRSPQPQPQPSSQAAYQAYKPFVSKYHVPRINTDLGPRASPRGSSRGPSRVDTASIARPYLPGEQTRSPTTNGVPATLTVGAGR